MDSPPSPTKFLLEMARDLSVLGERLSSGFAVLDHEGTITYANDILCRMLQCPRAALVGRRDHDTPLPYDIDQYRAYLSDPGQCDRGTVMTWRTFGGGELDLVVWAFPLFDPAGVCVGSFALLEPRGPTMEPPTARPSSEPRGGSMLPRDLGSPALSPREREILDALVEGQTLEQAAAAFRISPHTVRNHRKRIYRKLKIRSEAELLRLLFIGKPRADE